MQQEKALSELFLYVSGNPEQAVTDGSKATLSYLEACSKLFENGFLSHEKVDNLDCNALKSINEGFAFFTSWLNQIMDKGTT